MADFLSTWHQASVTSLGFFWMAFWAFGLGYLVSSLIQVLVTQARMQRTMGTTGPRSIALGTFFGFLSSSCSFAALATTRTLFQKGAGLVPSLAFLLASTNLVIELGFVIAIFLGWQFVVGEYLGGLLLILFAWAFVALTRPWQMVKDVRERLGGAHEPDDQGRNWRDKLRSREGWQQIGQTYVMEWQMVWKDVLIGFTVAGIIAAFVPASFYAVLFPGAGEQAAPGPLDVVTQTLVAPVAAFFTFIGSMGNIPLAAVLYDNGVGFAGVMAFVFSDLVVLPVLRINATYYGWKMSLYILLLLFCGLVAVSLTLHLGLATLDLLPQNQGQQSITQRDFFAFDYGFVLNLIFLAGSAALVVLWRQATPAHGGHGHHHDHAAGASLGDWILRAGVVICLVWLGFGLVVPGLVGA
ncbi:permease [Halomonas sp. V046]|uniref:permease n=1 Tax=Halomonas sp. V046 TaxID=3459611 RepID=UPI0040447911